ncbi:hypothetical protein [Nitrosomonas ureae]|uniref:Uncharacterized protein n=1 Tax=Nitrosomonas ureae TaxID=44577 RepID=A0A2T5IW08_9PROT|nr:hypothetical protein [Nitrosomonas ureae]PTQ88034.1 hypothetical protein C8R28_100233 [Nitrosomonas ureae]
MKAYNYKWLLVFFMLWLPLQGAAAAVLSVCAQENNLSNHADKSIVTIDSHHHDDCHKQAPDGTTINHVLTSLPCDDASCNAYSSTPVLSGYTAPKLIKITSVVPSLNSGFTSFVPEQPQRPPLPAFL